MGNIEKQRLYYQQNQPITSAHLVLAHQQEKRKRPFHRELKIVVIGDEGVGKSSIISRSLEKFQFSKPYKPTIGAEFWKRKSYYDRLIYQKESIVRAELEVTAWFWDTPGQQKYNYLLQDVLKQCDGLILVYDTSSADSFERVKTFWLKIFFYARLRQNFPVLLLGNKIDTHKIVDHKDVVRLAREKNMTYSYVSAKNGRNIRQSIDDLVLEIVKKQVSFVSLPLKDIYLTFLLGINDDFEDMLLQDALEMLAD